MRAYDVISEKKFTSAGEDASSQSGNGNVKESRDEGLFNICAPELATTSPSERRNIALRGVVVVAVAVIVLVIIVRGTEAKAAVVGAVAHRGEKG